MSYGPHTVLGSVLFASLAAAATTPQIADLILKHGAIFTMDADRSVVTAVAVKDGKIVFVGSDAGAEALRGSSTRVLDLQGQMVLPGLHDSHVHLTEGGLATLQCSLTGLTTVQQVLDKVASYANPPAPVRLRYSLSG